MTNIDTAVRRMFHMGKPIESIAQTHKISIQRVNKIISNQTGMSNTKTHPRQLRGKAFNAKVKAYANQGLSFNDIASIMGCSYSTIKRAFDDTKPKKEVREGYRKDHPSCHQEQVIQQAYRFIQHPLGSHLFLTDNNLE